MKFPQLVDDIFKYSREAIEVQGYFFSKSIPFEDFSKLLSQKKKFL